MYFLWIPVSLLYWSKGATCHCSSSYITRDRSRNWSIVFLKLNSIIINDLGILCIISGICIFFQRSFHIISTWLYYSLMAISTKLFLISTRPQPQRIKQFQSRRLFDFMVKKTILHQKVGHHSQLVNFIIYR